MRFFISIALGCILYGQGVEAKNNIEKIAEHGHWKVYTGTQNKQAICFMQSTPTKEEGSFTKRGEAIVTVTHRPEKNEFNVVSIKAGYSYKKDSDCSISIVQGPGKANSFSLFTHEDAAWGEDEKADAALVKSMKSGSIMVAKGESLKGTTSEDTYSLDGFTKAHEALSEACPRQSK